MSDKTSPLLHPDGAGPDLIGHADIADQLVDVIKESWNSKPKRGVLVGLTGQWGSGKSKICEIINGLNVCNIELVSLWDIAGKDVLVNLTERLALKFWGTSKSDADNNTKSDDDKLRLDQVRLELHSSYSGTVHKKNLGERSKHRISKVLEEMRVAPRTFLICFSFLFLLGCLIYLSLSLDGAESYLALNAGGVCLIGIFWWLLRRLYDESSRTLAVTMPPAKECPLLLRDLLHSVIKDRWQGKDTSDRPNVIWLDDLDRCPSSVIKETLIALRTHLPDNAVYVLAADESAIIDAFSTGEKASREAKSIINKILDHQVTIPPMRVLGRGIIIDRAAEKLQLQLTTSTRNVLLSAPAFTPRHLQKIVERMALISRLSRARQEKQPGNVGRLAPDRIHGNAGIQPSVARLAAIAEIWPEIWAMIERRPYLYPRLEYLAQSEDPEKELKLEERSLELSLVRFLKGTREHSGNTDFSLLHLMQEDLEIEQDVDLVGLEYALSGHLRKELYYDNNANEPSKAIAIVEYLLKNYQGLRTDISNYSHYGIYIYLLVRFSMVEGVSKEFRSRIARHLLEREIRMGARYGFPLSDAEFHIELLGLLGNTKLSDWDKDAIFGVQTTFSIGASEARMNPEIFDMYCKTKPTDSSRPLWLFINDHSAATELRQRVSNARSEKELIEQWLLTFEENRPLLEDYHETRHLICYDLSQGIQTGDNFIEPENWGNYLKWVRVVGTTEEHEHLKRILREHLMKPPKQESQSERKWKALNEGTKLIVELANEEVCEYLLKEVIGLTEMNIENDYKELNELKKNMIIAFRLAKRSGKAVRKEFVEFLTAHGILEKIELGGVIETVSDIEWAKDEELFKKYKERFCRE